MFGETSSKRRVMSQPERYPRLAAMLERINTQAYASQFEVALDGVIAGLQAYAEANPSRARPG